MERLFNMKAQTIEIQESTGRILSSAIFRPGGKKLMAKGHILREEDIRVLQSEGMERIWVTELEEGEVSEDEAVCAVAGEMACGSYEIQLAAGGRANLIATENCCVLVDDELLRQVNCTSGVVIATTINFSFALAGQRIATIKSAPFAVSKSDFDGLIGMLRERGPIMQARPTQGATVAVLYCDPGQRRPRAGSLRIRAAAKAGAFRRPLATPAWRFWKMRSTYRAACSNCCGPSRRWFWWLRPRPRRARPTWSAWPWTKIGCRIERFLAPVEPGNLLLMGYKDDVPIMSAPGCFRSLKPNVIDLMLPPMMARYRVSTWEVACLGHGGLLN